MSAAGCPSSAASLGPCSGAVRPGELCEAGGECGTTRVLNNCLTFHDVYQRIACEPVNVTSVDGQRDARGGHSAAILAGALGVPLVLLVLALATLSRRGCSSNWPAKPAVTCTRSQQSTPSSRADGAKQPTESCKTEALVVPNAL